MKHKIYPRTGDTQTVYLKSVVTRPSIKDGGKKSARQYPQSGMVK